jgi:type II secretory pathway component PulM
LVVLVDSTAQTFGLSLPRSRPDGADGINVAFQGVSFDALLSWLIALETTHGVAVESASFSSSRERGLVNGQLFLRRS